MKGLFLVLLVIPCALAASEVTATFEEDGAVGYLTIWENGTYHIMIDTTGAAWDGMDMTYHIHELWDIANNSASGALCGLAYTANHFDPTIACGANSDNPNCNLDCITDRSTAYSTRCSPDADPYSCEVGDLSGAHGPYVGGTFKEAHDFYLPHPDLLDGKSIVFHYGGSRVFCARLSAGTRTASGMRMRMEDNMMAVADFGPLGMVTYYADGTHSVDIDISSIAAELDADTTGCSASTFTYHIHTEWNHDDMMYKLLGNCSAAMTDFHYDPNLGCGANSANPECTSRYSGNCINGSTAGGGDGYNCNPTAFADNPYVCESGDTSGQYGGIASEANRIVRARTAFSNNAAAVAPPLDAIVDTANPMSVVFHCPGARAFCAPITAMAAGTTGTNVGTTGGTTGATTGGDSTTEGDSTTGTSAAGTAVPALFALAVTFLAALMC